MTTIADSIKTAMEANTALMAVLTGGVHVGFSEINRQDTPSAFDVNKEIKPCALVKVGTEVPRGPYKRSTQTVVMIYFYERAGNVNIESAIDKTYNLLHDTKIGEVGTFALLHDNTVHNYELMQREKNALEYSMAMMRFLQPKTK